MWLLPLVSVGLTFLSVSNGQVTFTHSLEINFRAGVFQLQWFSNDKEITFEASAPTVGWVGVGFNSKSDLRAGDLFVSWLDPSGVHSQDSLIDRHVANVGLMVLKDTKQDYKLAEGYPKEEAKKTTVRFSRQWSTCDLNHDLALNGSTAHLILAFGASDPRQELLDQPGPQLLRITDEMRSGFVVKPINLKSDTFKKPTEKTGDTAEKLEVRDILMDATQIPLPQSGSFPDTFSYTCQMEKLPVEPTKSVTAYEAKRGLLNENKIYTIRLFACPASFQLPMINGQGIQEKVPFECRPQGSQQKILDECAEMLINAGAGERTVKFPDNVGLPLAASDFGGRYVLLQIVHDTSVGKSGRNGLSLHLTNKAVQRRVGQLLVQSEPGFRTVIPPRVKETRVRTICHTRCGAKNFPQDGINIFAVSHHTRKLGRSVRTRLIRNATEVAVISDDSGHSWLFEPTINLERAVKVLPGDQIVVECMYNTSESVNPSWVFGGWGSNDETCAAVFHYHPAIPGLFSCGSSVEPRHVLPIFFPDYEGFFGVSGNNSQYEVKEADFRTAVAGHPTQVDRCTLVSVHSLSFEKPYIAMCNNERMEQFDVVNFDLMDPVEDKQCPGIMNRVNFEYRWPESCPKRMFGDEIPKPKECPKTNTGWKLGVFNWLLLSFLVVSVF